MFAICAAAPAGEPDGDPGDHRRRHPSSAARPVRRVPRSCRPATTSSACSTAPPRAPVACSRRRRTPATRISIARTTRRSRSSTAPRTAPTTRDAYATARSASQFLGTEPRRELAITPADLAAYGIDGTMRRRRRRDRRTLIVTAKAFQLRLTSSVVLPGAARRSARRVHRTSTTLQSTAAEPKRVLDAFMADLAARTDDVTHEPLSDDIVITIEGDTPKTPLDRTNWLDDTPANSNWIYVYGGGKLKTGWFGGIDRNGDDDGLRSAHRRRRPRTTATSRRRRPSPRSPTRSRRATSGAWRTSRAWISRG